MSETQLSSAIRQALTASGCLVLRQQAGSIPLMRKGERRYVRMGTKGTPDLLVLFSRVGCSGLTEYGFVEVKTLRGQLSSAQQAWHEMAADCGIRCRVARSVGDALAILKEWRSV